MARAERNWDRLVRAALRGDRLVGGAYGHPVTGIAGIVPSSLGNNVHIEEVLRAADEIQDEDPTVARIRKLRCHFFPAAPCARPTCYHIPSSTMLTVSSPKPGFCTISLVLHPITRELLSDC
jgi:hypothetical protein